MTRNDRVEPREKVCEILSVKATAVRMKKINSQFKVT